MVSSRKRSLQQAQGEPGASSGEEAQAGRAEPGRATRSRRQSAAPKPAPAARPAAAKPAAKKAAKPAPKPSAPAAGDSDTVTTNRAPVLTLWAAVVAQRQGFSWEESLTFGRYVSGILAQSKGRSLGLYEEHEKTDEEREERAARDAQLGVERVEVFGIRCPAAPVRGVTGLQGSPQMWVGLRQGGNWRVPGSAAGGLPTEPGCLTFCDLPAAAARRLAASATLCLGTSRLSRAPRRPISSAPLETGWRMQRFVRPAGEAGAVGCYWAGRGRGRRSAGGR